MDLMFGGYRVVAPVIAFLGVGLVSCEDKAALAKIAQQKEEIMELEAQESKLKAAAKGDPPGDPAADLAEARKDLEDLNAEIVQLEEERDALREAHEAKVKEFETYKRKYFVPE